MAFARIVITTALFFFSLIGAGYLRGLFFPPNYSDLNYIHIAAGYILLFFSLGVPAFVVRLTDKNTDFKEVFFACVAFAVLMAMEALASQSYEKFSELFFITLSLTVFSALFSLLGFALAAKIRGGSTKSPSLKSNNPSE